MVYSKAGLIGALFERGLKRKRLAEPSCDSVQARPGKCGDGHKHRPRREHNGQSKRSKTGRRECHDNRHTSRGRGHFERGKHRERRTDRSQRQGQRLDFATPTLSFLGHTHLTAGTGAPTPPIVYTPPTN